MLFYDWKDPLLERRGEDGLYHRPPRPGETPPCGRRAKCPLIGRGAGLPGEKSSEEREFAERRAVGRENFSAQEEGLSSVDTQPPLHPVSRVHGQR